MRSGGQWAVAAALLAGVVFAWPTYVRYFGLHPGPMVAALFIAFAMYLPSLWAIRFLDRHDPEPPLLFWGSIAFVILFAPITSRVMHAIIDGGLVPYWIVVGPLEELTKLLPLVLIAVFGRRADLRTAIPGRWALGTESHIIWGATAGIGIGHILSRKARGASVPTGLAIVALVMATHGLNDWLGKFIGPLALVLLVGPSASVGVDLNSFEEGSLLSGALLVYAAIANTLVMNLLLWPVLFWGVRRSHS
jgi:hypothetical protein